MTTTITPASQIYADFNQYMAALKRPYNSWYVGITSDIKQRLFTDHAVAKQSYWIWRRASDHTVARAIEMDYHKAGCQGSYGGGNYTAVYIYAYLITDLTVE